MAWCEDHRCTNGDECQAKEWEALRRGTEEVRRTLKKRFRNAGTES